jgi:NDP-sugar pyrophosphorylase family protein
MKAVIMAGGLGERLKPLTKIIPKSLLPVGNKSILEIQIMNLQSHGVRDIYLALGYKHELFEAYFGNGSRWGVNIHYSTEKKPLGTAGPLTLLRSSLDEPFLVMNGDILSNLNFKELSRAHRTSGAAVTVATKVITLPLRYGVIKHQDGSILDIEEKPSLSAEINAGIYFMNPAVIDLMPDDTPVSMDALLRNMIAHRYRVSRFLLEAYWLDIGQMGDYEKATDFITEDENGQIEWRAGVKN